MLASLRAPALAVFALTTLVGLSGCPQGQSGRGHAGHQANGDAGAAHAPAQPGYTVDVELPPETTPGQEALARVRVQPKAPWHMNLEYPAKLKLVASDQVSLDSALLHKADAERFDDQELVFSVLFTPKATGPHTIEAEVDFAVCGDKSCGPVTEAVQLAFEASCREGEGELC